jgi:hypothetical protein
MSYKAYNNKLWQGHRLILPEVREIAVNTCRDCRFFVEIQGKEEARWGCVVSVPRYGTLERRVPRQIHLLDISNDVGREGLEEILSHSYPEAQACGKFCNRV